MFLITGGQRSYRREQDSGASYGRQTLAQPGLQPGTHPNPTRRGLQASRHPVLRTHMPSLIRQAPARLLLRMREPAALTRDGEI